MGRDDELLELNRGEPRKKRASTRKKERRADGELGKKGVVDLATFDGRARGDAPRRPRTASGELLPPYCALCATGRREGERLTGGGHV